MPDTNITNADTVAALLQMHGIAPSPAEVQQLVDAFPSVRAGVASLYSMPGVRYEEPAITFDPRV